MTILCMAAKNGLAALGTVTVTFEDEEIHAPSDVAVRAKEVFEVQNNLIGTYGHPLFQMLLEDYLKSHSNWKLDSELSIHKAFIRFHHHLREHEALNIHCDDDDEFESSRFKAFIINPSGLYQVYRMRSVVKYKKYWATGSGADFALGAMDILYDQLESPQEMVERSIEVAARFHSAVIGPVECKTLSLAP